MIKHLVLIGMIGTTLPLAPVFGQSSETDTDAEKQSRVGSCEDARSQMQYFCEEKEQNSNDMMIGFNACNNAQKNVKEACEGIVEADVEYKFEKN